MLWKVDVISDSGWQQDNSMENGTGRTIVYLLLSACYSTYTAIAIFRGLISSRLGSFTVSTPFL